MSKNISNTVYESKKKSISQIASIGRKYRVLKYPILLFLVLFIFVYNFTFYFCKYFKMKERMAKAVAIGMCLILLVTSIDLTAFALAGDGEAVPEKSITGIISLDDEISVQKVEPDATIEDIVLPESLDVHVTYQVEKEIEVEVEVEKDAEAEDEQVTPTPSAESTLNSDVAPNAESTPAMDIEPGTDPTSSGEATTEVPQGENTDVPEEISGEESQNADVSKQDVPADETPKEGSQSDSSQPENTQSEDAQGDNAQSNDTQSNDSQNEDSQGNSAESQSDGEQTAKLTNVEYGSTETVYVPMEYCATESTGEEVTVETIEQSSSIDESGDENRIDEAAPAENVNGDQAEPKADSEIDSRTVTEKEIVIEEVSEDVAVSIEWSIDEENSSKAEFEDLEAGEEYIFVPAINEEGYSLKEGVELPNIKVVVEENLPAFVQSVTVDGVVITVTADEGVFPEDATVEARKVTKSEENEVEEAIDEVRDEEKNVAVSYTFDITIYDKDGNEIEPDTEEGSVKVTFKMAEIANENLETEVYHVKKTEDGLNAEGLAAANENANTEDANTDGTNTYGGDASGSANDEITVETTGFSFYTVEFTYGELQYVLEGDERVELTTILDAVGIKENGEITAVVGSDDELFKPVFDEEEKAWYIEALKAFGSEEWLKVTIGGVEYEIVVTDAANKVIIVETGVEYNSVSAAINAVGNGQTIKMLMDSTENIGVGENKNFTLDLNGKVLKGAGNASVIDLNGTVTLIDSDKNAEHKGTVSANNLWTWDGGNNTGDVIIRGGIITGGGNTNRGGGVFVSGQTFNMYGGTIAGCSCNRGGGVYVNSGTFNMGNETSDCVVISYCSVNNDGGGVYLNDGTTMTMSGYAQIHSCVAPDAGGGVFSNGNSTLTMKDHSIIGAEGENGQSNPKANKVTAGTNSRGAGYRGNPHDKKAPVLNLQDCAAIINNLGTSSTSGVSCGTESVNKVNVKDSARVLGNGFVNNGTWHESNLAVNRVENLHITGDLRADAKLCIDADPTQSNMAKPGEQFGTVDNSGYYVEAENFANDYNTRLYARVKDGNKLIWLGDPAVRVSNDNGTNWSYYDNLPEAVSAVDTGSVCLVEVLKDIALTDTISVNKKFTLRTVTENWNDPYTGVSGTAPSSNYTVTAASGKSIFYINSGADVLISDIMLKGGSNANVSYGGVYVNGGSFTMGGAAKISGFSTNNSCNGGGVYINGGTFTMTGGTISKCSASNFGGGVYVYQGTFSMSGNSIISECTAKVNGGGVYVGEGSKVTLTGGEIKENSAVNRGGGVEVVYATENIILGGNIIISGNVCGTAADNVFLGKDKRIDIGTGDDAPKSGMSVGVTLQNGTGNVTGTTGTGQYAQYFSSDNTSYQVFSNNDYVYIGTITGTGNALNVNKGTKYDTIASAISNATAGDTIRLLGDFEENVIVNRKITLDLNGQVLKGVSSGRVISVNDGAELTLVDSNPTTLHYFTVGSDNVWKWDDSKSDGAKSIDSLTARANTNDVIAVSGGCITGGRADCGSGIYLNSNSKLVMNAGNIVGNNSTGSGNSGVVIVSSSAEFTMNGGRVCGNAAANCGGGVENGGTFELNDGVISDNYAAHNNGSAIQMNNENASTLIRGGLITRNYVGHFYNNAGGAVHMCNGQFMMTGGTVTGNIATNTMDGGVTIQGNTGVTATIGGTAKIVDNISGGTVNNLYLSSGKTVSIASGTDVPKSGMTIGVTTQTAPTTTSVAITDSNSTDYSSYFTSDNSVYTIINDNNIVKLGKKADNTIHYSHGIYDGFVPYWKIGTAPADGKITYGNTMTLPASTSFTNVGYKLAGWTTTKPTDSTATKEYDAGATLTAEQVNALYDKCTDGAITLYAVWERDTVNVAWNATKNENYSDLVTAIKNMGVNDELFIINNAQYSDGGSGANLTSYSTIDGGKYLASVTNSGVQRGSLAGDVRTEESRFTVTRNYSGDCQGHMLGINESITKTEIHIRNVCFTTSNPNGNHKGFFCSFSNAVVEFDNVKVTGFNGGNSDTGSPMIRSDDLSRGRTTTYIFRDCQIEDNIAKKTLIVAGQYASYAPCYLKFYGNTTIKENRNSSEQHNVEVHGSKYIRVGEDFTGEIGVYLSGSNTNMVAAMCDFNDDGVADENEKQKAKALADGTSGRVTSDQGYRLTAVDNTVCVAKTATVTFNSNGATIGSLPETAKVDGVDTAITNSVLKAYYDAKVTIPGAGTLSKADSLFMGWNTKSDGTGNNYEKDAICTVNADNINLYANWKNIVASVDHNGTITNYDTLQKAVDAAATGDTVKLLRDTKENITVEANKDFTLDLNGKVIKGTGSGSVVTINSGAKLTLIDSNKNEAHTGEFTDLPAGGVITGGQGKPSTDGNHGGGVYVNDGGSLTMNAGTIANCDVTGFGGGVWTKGTFTMEGQAKIINCKANKGGGVWVDGGTFTMTGGTISNNTSTQDGGGLNIYLDNDGITIGGTAKITGNKKGDTNNNLYLPSGKNIGIGVDENAPQSGMSVGITTQTKPTVGNDINITGTNGSDYSSYFTSDDSAYSVKNDSNVIKLMKNVSTVTTAPEAKTSLEYNTSEQELVTAGVAEHGTMNYAIGDVTSTEAPGDSAWNTSIPTGTNAGTYRVWFKSVGDTNYSDSIPAYVDVTIAKAQHAVTPPTALNPTYNGSEQILISEGSSTTGTIEYSLDGDIFVAGIGSILATNPGSYTVYYKVEGDSNYETYGPESITAKIIKKPDPTPTPDPSPKPDPGPAPSPEPDPGPAPSPEPDDPVVTPTAPPKGSYAETGLTTKRYVPNGGTTAGIGSLIGVNDNQIPLPYVTKESEKAGWTSIDQALKSYKKTKESKTEPFNVTMNGYATVDNQLLSDVNTQKVDLALNLDNDVVVVVPKENKVISDAIAEWDIENSLKMIGQSSAIQTPGLQTRQPKLSDDVYFRVSAITTNDAKSNRMTNAGLDIKDIQAIGGDANTPVVKVVTSNTSVGLLKSQMIQISFDTTKMTAKYKPGDTVYLYNGSAKAGVGCYTVGVVDKDGKVSFWVPMVSSYWTIGDKNLGSKIMKRK